MENYLSTLFYAGGSREKFIEGIQAAIGQIAFKGIFTGDSPERISFLHLDVSDPNAEAATFARLFDRVSIGGAIILNYCGWLSFPHHRAEADRLLADRGCMALKLPTGQGLIIK